MNEKILCTYILANKRNGTLYTGVTGDLIKRVDEHRNDKAEGFTKRYKIHTLVYYEVADTMLSAIEREKQIKAGSRKKKLDMIEKMNPEWKDLFNQL